jgi:glycerophosphoryl diester phosphodiesterase
MTALAARSFPYDQGTLNLAHRGARAFAPENTMAAFALAIQQCAHGVELDVMLSTDGVPMVIHDQRVDRTTDGIGRVSDLTSGQLRKLDAGSWFSPEFAGERLPTLSEVLAWAEPHTLLNIELKAPGLSPGKLEEEVTRLVHQHHASARVLLSSFNPLTLRRLRRIDPGLRTGLLYAPNLPVPLRRAWLRPLALPDALHPEHTMVDRRYIHWARARGYRVNVWAPDSRSDLDRLVGLGVDAIITDRPDVLAGILASPQVNLQGRNYD